jgi:hypothetical protein
VADLVAEDDDQEGRHRDDEDEHPTPDPAARPTAAP